MFPLCNKRKITITSRNKLKEIRKARGFTQASIAERIPTSSVYYCRIENGSTHPSVAMVYRILQVLNADFNDCFRIVVEPRLKMLDSEAKVVT